MTVVSLCLLSAHRLLACQEDRAHSPQGLSRQAPLFPHSTGFHQCSFWGCFRGQKPAPLKCSLPSDATPVRCPPLANHHSPWTLDPPSFLSPLILSVVLGAHRVTYSSPGRPPPPPDISSPMSCTLTLAAGGSRPFADCRPLFGSIALDLSSSLSSSDVSSWLRLSYVSLAKGSQK